LARGSWLADIHVNNQGVFPMRRYLLATAAATVAFAVPAAARDNSGYVGIEGGVMSPKSQTLEGTITFTTPGTPGPVNVTRTNIGNVKYKTGYDVDVIGGYDFGMFRLEGELGYKHAKTKSASFNTAFITALNAGAGTAFTSSTNFGLSDKVSAFSAMINGLLDVGGEGGSIGGYAGGGVGYADEHQFNGSKGKFAWQLMAGVYYPISDQIDIGLKYRYFHAGGVSGSHNFARSE